MADQQFLASFGVDIDESGVSRLQKILSENRTLADSLSASFDVASESVKAFRESISEDFPTLFSGSGYGNVTENLFGEYAGLKIGLNMTEPKKEIASFTESAKKPIPLTANASSIVSAARTAESAKKPIPLTANASSIVSAARTAMESVRSLFSETFTLNVRAETNTDRKSEEPSSRQDSRNREETGSAFLRMSSGGRVSRPTSVQVAEDGDAEYIIPVKKENKALPLLRQLLAELSPAARASLTGGAGTGTAAMAASIPSVSSVAASTMTQNNQNVSAPVTINVNASGSDANRIGQSIYDTAERYLLRTLKGAYS